jgi:plasmid stability protein
VVRVKLYVFARNAALTDAVAAADSFGIASMAVRGDLRSPRGAVDEVAQFLQNGGTRGGDMANLNIKNLPDKLYKKLRARAKRQHRSVAQEVTHILEEVLEGQEPLSILELRGLGKELWEAVDAERHVDAERRSWD